MERTNQLGDARDALGAVSRQARAPWDITERRLPKDASTEDKLRAAVDYAVLAPSGHNTQPWRFKVVDSALETAFPATPSA